MKQTAVINVVGLSSNLLGEHTPRLNAFAARGAMRKVKPVFPALTCSSQSTYLTGRLPSEHGVIGNGWYFRDLAQVWLWRQVNRLVQADKIWDVARRQDPKFTCANLFWWFNMYSSVDWAVTPRPIYRADGLKMPDIHTEPMSLRDELNAKLGEFPLFQFWGPGASIVASEWIARAALEVHARHKPTLTLIYLPHLDYVLQREGPRGPSVPRELAQIDRVCGELIDELQARGTQVVVLSEYGINEVTQAVHINRVLRSEGLVSVRVERGEEHFDAGASRAFAVADHQIAHVYVRDPQDVARVRSILEQLDGVEEVLDREEQRARGIEHERSGELLAVAKQDRWFAYPYWLDDSMAPDYARTVDIHRKPGYDPVELFLDPRIKLPKLHIARRIAAKLLGFRYLMDVIPFDTGLVRGSHGRADVPEEYYPLLMTERSELLPAGKLDPLAIQDLLLRHLSGTG